MRLQIWLLVLGFGLLIQTPVSASSDQNETIPMLGSGHPINPDTVLDDIRYQIGDEWGKKAVTAEYLQNITNLARIARGTVNIRGATGFYLGEFAGEHLFATNHHVCPTARSCVGQNLRFSLLELSFPVDSFVGTWSNIDLTIITAKVNDRHLASLAAVSNPFRFDSPIFPGQKLLTVGFGSASNPRRQLVANWDQDCIVFSQQGDYRFMKDPDQFNQGSYRSWSFANGCDVSHGDSGSAIVDRSSGAVIGLIWTGKIPKSTNAQKSDVIQSWIDQQSELVWQELSYAVPVDKIARVLDDSIANQSTPLRVRHLLSLVREVR